MALKQKTNVLSKENNLIYIMYTGINVADVILIKSFIFYIIPLDIM